MGSRLDEQTLLSIIRKEILFKEEDCDFDEDSNLDGVRNHLEELLNNINNMNRTWVIQEQNLTDDGTIVSKFKKLVKRCIRKSIYWFLRPYIDQQIDFNGAVVRSISEAHKILEKLERKVD